MSRTSKRRRAPGGGREEILAAAKHEFAAKGFAAASTAGIARLAKVTQPLVHHHFKSKRALWLAAADELFGPLLAALHSAQVEAQSLPIASRFEHLLRTVVRYFGRHPQTARLIRLETLSSGEAFGLLFERWLAPMFRLIEEELGAAVRAGVVIPVDARLAVFMVTGAVGQPFCEPRVARRAFALDVLSPDVIEAYADLIVRTMLHGLLSSPR